MASRFVVSLLFAIIVALFAIQNSGVVTINFLFAEYPVSQALVILISAALGAIIVMLLGAVKQFKLQRKNKEQGKILEEKDKVIVEKDKVIQDKDNVIQEKERTIELLQDQINKKEQQEQDVSIEKSETNTLEDPKQE